jgi:hypothetical protein
MSFGATYPPPRVSGGGWSMHTKNDNAAYKSAGGCVGSSPARPPGITSHTHDPRGDNGRLTTDS